MFAEDWYTRFQRLVYDLRPSEVLGLKKKLKIYIPVIHLIIYSSSRNLDSSRPKVRSQQTIIHRFRIWIDSSPGPVVVARLNQQSERVHIPQ